MCVVVGGVCVCCRRPGVVVGCLCVACRPPSGSEWAAASSVATHPSTDSRRHRLLLTGARVRRLFCPPLRSTSPTLHDPPLPPFERCIVDTRGGDGRADAHGEGPRGRGRQPRDARARLVTIYIICAVFFVMPHACPVGDAMCVCSGQPVKKCVCRFFSPPPETPGKKGSTCGTRSRTSATRSATTAGTSASATRRVARRAKGPRCRTCPRCVTCAVM